ncbi:MAG TPA: ABC transporter permease, partial [Longimicrobiales bacterium]|nr:ABC transporter permease [Longimicrobiales bacterium]
LVDRLLVRDPAHVIDAAGLVRLYGTVERPPQGAQTSSWIPWAYYERLRADMTSLDGAGAYRTEEALVGRGGDARMMRTGQATGSFFQALGVQPVRGRFFDPAEDAAVAGELAVISAGLWRSRFGGDEGVIGQAIEVGDGVHTIVGVTPDGFSGTELRRVDVWVLGSSATANTMNWQVVGRLRAGVSMAAASAEAAALHRAAAGIAPPSFRWFEDASVFAAPISLDARGREPLEATMSRWLAIVTGLLLLVTIANVVNLLLVRLARRQRELAVRMVLGSGRWRVLRLLAVEGLLLVAAGAILSVAVAAVAEPFVRRALFADEATWTSPLDARLVIFLLGLSLLTVLLITVGPAVHVGRGRFAGELRMGPHGGPAASSRTRAALTVAQAALSVALLIGAGLFMRSMANVRSLDLGVDASRVVEATLQLPPPTRGTFDEWKALDLALHRRAVDVVRALPGVEFAAIAVGRPLDGGRYGTSIRVAGFDSIPTLPGGGPFVSTVGSDYFATTGTAIVSGRVFTDSDREGSEPVVIIGREMARLLWPNGQAIGQCIGYGDVSNPCARVVGIAADVHRVGLHQEPSLQFYIPLGQQSMFSGSAILVRPTADRPITFDALRDALVAIDPAIRAVELEYLSASLADELRPLRLGIVTFGLSSLLALAVAVLGLYGLMSYLVAWRRRELGVRIALGASAGQIITLVVGSGARLAAAGVALGLAIAFAGRGLVQPHLFETSATEPAVFLGVAVVLLLVGFMAGIVPARRALHISPAESLRSE